MNNQAANVQQLPTANHIVDGENLTSTTDMVLNHQAMAQMDNLAGLMANGKSTVPKHLQGNKADCMAVVMQSAQWKMNPFAVSQKTHLVNGTLGYEAQLVSAVIQSSTAITGRFHYEYGGNWNTANQPNSDAWVRCGAVLAGETQIQWGEQLYVGKVTTKNSPLWKTAPKQQAAYLATKYWARLYAPAVILGVYSTDELPDRQPRQAKDITPQGSKLESVLNKTSPIEAQAQEVQQEALPDKSEQLSLDILSCSTMAELTEVGKAVASAVEAGQITTEQRQLLGNAYTSKQKKLQAENVDVETGEVTE